jgi:hypothetical protein
MNNHYNAAAEISINTFCCNTHNDNEEFEGLNKYSVSAGEESKEIEKANMAFHRS